MGSVSILRFTARSSIPGVQRPPSGVNDCIESFVSNVWNPSPRGAKYENTCFLKHIVSSYTFLCYPTSLCIGLGLWVRLWLLDWLNWVLNIGCHHRRTVSKQRKYSWWKYVCKQELGFDVNREETVSYMIPLRFFWVGFRIPVGSPAET